MLGLLMWNLLPIANAAAADDSPPQRYRQPASMKVNVGLAGVWKIGHVTPVKVELPDALDQDARTIEVQTFDGDGVPVTYRQAIHRDASKSPGESSQYWTMVTIGRSDRSMKVTVSNESGSALSTEVLGPEQLGRPLPTIQPWIVALGSSLGVEATGITQTDTGLPNFTTTVLDTADQLPDQWRGLSACECSFCRARLASRTSRATRLTSHLLISHWLSNWQRHSGRPSRLVPTWRHDDYFAGPVRYADACQCAAECVLARPRYRTFDEHRFGTLESATATKFDWADHRRTTR